MFLMNETTLFYFVGLPLYTYSRTYQRTFFATKFSETVRIIHNGFLFQLQLFVESVLHQVSSSFM